MTDRVRSRGKLSSVYHGSYRQIPYTSYGTPHLHSTTYRGVDQEVCRDSTCPYPFTEQQDLYLVKEKLRPPGLTGTHKYFGTDAKHSNTELSVPPIVGIAALFERDAVYITKALANENTQQGIVDLPNMLAELRDFPGMIKNMKTLGEKLIKAKGLGNLNPRDYADAYLLKQFGMVPLISDVQSLLKLQQHVAERQRRINRLGSGASVKGTLEKYKTSKTGSVLTSVQGGLGLKLSYTTKVESHVWYSMRAFPGSGVPKKLQTKAAQLGFNQPLVSIWNSIPWSFLVDYFTNIGDFIGSQGSDYEIESICIMKQRKISTEWRVAGTFPASPLYYGNASYKVSSRPSFSQTKERNVHLRPRGSVVYSPWLTPGQTRNITALLISGGKSHWS